MFGYVSGTIRKLGIMSGSVCPASTAASTYAGSLIGYLSGTVVNCYSNATVTFSITNIVYAGGLVGVADSTATIINSYASGSVSATSSSGFAYAGGFVGANKGTVESSLAFGDVTARGSNETYSRNGGFVDVNTGTLTYCYRNEKQVLTKYTPIGGAYCNDGICAPVADMLAYVTANWDSSIWVYDLMYPSHK